MVRVSVVWLGVMLVGAMAMGQEDGTDPEDARIEAVLRREKDVIALTERGLFRAVRGERAWRALPRPPFDPARGRMCWQPAKRKDFLYCADRLFILRDDGAAWQVLSERRGFFDALRVENGTIYALGRGEDSVKGADCRVLMSKDQGATWKDITNGQRGADHLEPDPDHPNLVCLYRQSIRGYICQAEDETFQWEDEPAMNWWGRHETDEEFLSGGSSRTLNRYEIHATLANYFDYDFEGPRAGEGFRVVPEHRGYRFRRSEPKVIKIEVQFFAPGKEVELADGDSAVGLFGLYVIEPGGKRVPDPWDFENEPVRPDAGRLTRRTLRAPESYWRSIDLGKLYPFDKPGVYRVGVYYQSIKPAQAVGEELTFGGAPFVVEIAGE